VVSIVHPIHAPMDRIAIKAMNTGIARSQYLTSLINPIALKGSVKNRAMKYPTATITHTMNMTPPIV